MRYSRTGYATHAQPLRQYASKDGENLLFNANGNYSSTPVYWELRPPSGEVWVICQLMIHIAAAFPMDGGAYGSILGGLTNGIIIGVVRNGIELYSFTGPVPIKKNNTLNSLNPMYPQTQPSYTQTFTTALDFNHFGQWLKLDGAKDEALRITLNDNLTSLQSHYFIGYGHKLP